MNSSSKKTKIMKQIFEPSSHNASTFLVDEEDEEMGEKSSSIYSSASEMEDGGRPLSVPGGRVHKLMLKKMMLKLYKILCQTPEVSDLRSRLKCVKQVKTVVFNLQKPSMQTLYAKTPAEPSFTCPVTLKVYDNVLDMLVITVLSHHDVHIKAQLRDKGVLILNYEVGNSNTFPALGPQHRFLHLTPTSKALSIYETKIKVFARTKIWKNLSKQPAELDRLAKRIGFSADELKRFSQDGQGASFFAKKGNAGRPELFQYRLLRALVQNIFAFEPLTSDTVPDLLPAYSKALINPIVKFKSMNFFNKTVLGSASIPYSVYKKVHSKYAQRFEALVGRNNLFHSYPLGQPLKFEELLVDSECELDYALPEHLLVKTLAFNPNINAAERLIITLYTKTFHKLLSHYDYLNATCLIAHYPLPISTFPGQVMRHICDLLQGTVKKQMAGAVGAVCGVLRLSNVLPQTDYEEVMAWAASDV